MDTIINPSGAQYCSSNNLRCVWMEKEMESGGRRDVVVCALRDKMIVFDTTRSYG